MSWKEKVSAGLILISLSAAIIAVALSLARERSALAEVTPGNWQEILAPLRGDDRTKCLEAIVSKELLIGCHVDQLVATIGEPHDKSVNSHRLRWPVGTRRSAAPIMFPYVRYLVVSVGDDGRINTVRLEEAD